MKRDLNKNSIVDIWNGKLFYNIRKRLQEKNRNIYPCSNCDYYGGGNQNMVRYVK